MLPHIQRTYFDVFFPAESIGTLSFAVRTHFSGQKWNSVSNAKKLKKFTRFKLLAAPIKKRVSKNLRAQFYWHLKIQSFKKSKFYMPLSLKIYIFGRQIWHIFSRNYIYRHRVEFKMGSMWFLHLAIITWCEYTYQCCNLFADADCRYICNSMRFELIHFCQCLMRF